MFTPMRKKSEAGLLALESFFMDIEVTIYLHTDGTPELNHGEWKEVRTFHCGVRQSNTEPHYPFQNRVEPGIIDLKKHFARQMQRKDALAQLWGYCDYHTTEIRSRMVHNVSRLRGRTPHDKNITGDTPDLTK